MIRVLNVQQDKVEGGGIRQFLSRKGDQNSLGKKGCIAQWPPMKTPRWRIDRVADLLSNYLKFKVAHLRGAFSLCYIYKDNGGGTASCKLYYIYI